MNLGTFFLYQKIEMNQLDINQVFWKFLQNHLFRKLQIF